ncbi:hypothetical protein [Bradyrhizobium sp. LMTR 3]|uniref:hypothetical protein n=1 Tax=Bradyrhizobium sp. LMTR 3 TaxID=189873 RepID=UPI0011476206|nr:hypothetical protein [Bradyrhizobium sp. LMTR 3]
MHPHYLGKEGKQRRIEGFKNQRLIGPDNVDVAIEFSEVADVEEYVAGQQLFSEKNRSYKVYFVFSGRVDLLIGNRRILPLSGGTLQGYLLLVSEKEMRPLLIGSERLPTSRSATL